MTTWNMTQQVCATCRYWNGRRKIDFMAQFVNVEESTADCNGPDGSFRFAIVSEGGTCGYWSKYR
jgi:hypothetical protein